MFHVKHCVKRATAELGFKGIYEGQHKPIKHTD
jgi:hypothetical protein